MLERLLSRFRPLPDVAPVIVGGTGGSGTRVVQSILEHAGLFMGTHLNESKDALDFEAYLDRFINPIMALTQGLDYRAEDLPADLRAKALAGLRACTRDFLKEYPKGARWGLKTPRIMYVAPLFHALYPEMTFIHVVRDGRDMALSANRNQPRKHYQAVSGDTSVEPESPLAAIRLWATANGGIAQWGRRTLANRYYRLRFEDLCERPAESIEALLTAAGVSGTATPAMLEEVQPPSSLGRWKTASETDIRQWHAQFGETLTTLGYGEFIA